VRQANHEGDDAAMREIRLLYLIAGRHDHLLADQFEFAQIWTDKIKIGLKQ
jgi:hypothetical protein